MKRLLTLLLLCAAPVQAQDDPGNGVSLEIENVDGVATGAGAILRGLDKVNAEFQDIEILNGTSVRYERLVIDLGECRYPENNPAGDAYAFLTIRDQGAAEPVFQGWMLASSPALNALDHSRYDVWVLRCKTS
ncbi:DUF2155 domain-containing protein [Thalassovita sp.]|jgi:hypothetical protein|uniref:DUF2155 domain-containing protein n=1 Tax=Thalassovita sp. TaxID=1979401 RepID=UPI003B58DEDE